MTRGSWPALLGLSALFLLLFVWQRNRSSFLAIEQQRPMAERLAAEHALAVPDVLALRYSVVSGDIGIGDSQPSQAEQHWRLAVTEFARTKSGPRQALAAMGADELAVRRFLLLRERFASRR